MSYETETSKVGSEIINNTAVISIANTDTQLIIVSHANPAKKKGKLRQLHIYNAHATNVAVIKIYDKDMTSTGTVPPTVGSIAAPILPPYRVAAGENLILGLDRCPRIDIIGGLTAQSDNIPVTVYTEIEQY